MIVVKDVNNNAIQLAGYNLQLFNHTSLNFPKKKKVREKKTLPRFSPSLSMLTKYYWKKLKAVVKNNVIYLSKQLLNVNVIRRNQNVEVTKICRKNFLKMFKTYKLMIIWLQPIQLV